MGAESTHRKGCARTFGTLTANFSNLFHMSQSTVNNKRIAKNTILLYLRMFFTMAVTLYTSRVVLKVLGIDDYGLFNVVGGIIAMFGFLNSAMSSATQRYLTFELGRGDAERLRTIFATSQLIHILIAAVVLILGETVGLWFLFNKMVIPEGRELAAMWVYQCSVFSSMVMIMSVPFNAVIIAHERMSAFAYISILEVTLKLMIVFMLTISPADKLTTYAILLLAIQLLIRIIYGVYCARHFKESHAGIQLNKPLFREMTAFAGWNLWGNCAGVLSTQGVNILLNMFFGPAVNAARGVAVQVQSAVHMFATNFQTALNPQITKTYAQDDLASMHLLIARSSRFSFYLLFVFALPIFIVTYDILDLWLVEVPQYSDVFLRFSLGIVIIDSIANPLMISAQATGNVKKYQSVVGGVILLITPVAYAALKLGCTPDMVYFVHLAVCIVAFIVRLFIISPMIKISISRYLMLVLPKCLSVLATSIIIPLLADYFWEGHTIMRTLSISVISAMCVCIATYLLGLETSERNFIDNKITVQFQKLYKR